MLDVASKAFFQALSSSRTLKALASRYGMSARFGFARRFIAGETIEDAIAAVRAINSQGLCSTLDHLGESVTSLADAEAATRDYLALIDEVDRAGVERNLSLKLSQIGLDIDRAVCLDNLRKILSAGERCGFFVRIDMESSAYTDATLEIFESAWKLGHRGVGVVLQAYLYRTTEDFERINALGARIRLVKGAYREPGGVAFQKKSDVDAAFLRLAARLLVEGNYPAIATHDEALLARVKQIAGERGVARDRFEFQMLYGIRRDLQTALRDEGYRMRIYVPFGREWFPYFMRRLGERPANVGFVIRALFADR